MVKKVFISAYTEQNLGDDMFIKYICNRYPNVIFYTICKPEFSSAFCDVKNLIILDSDKESKDIDFNLHIVVGGSLFMQSVNKSIYEKYQIDKHKEFKNIPTYIIGTNFGPYRSKLFLLLYRQLFKKCKQIVFRDRNSYNLFKFRNMDWAPDILFNYKLPIYLKKKAICISCIKQNKRTGLRNYDEDIYISKLAEIANQYASLGFQIILANFSLNQEDNVAANMIFNNLTLATQSVTKIISYQGNIECFLKEILSTQYIIGTRFHSIILGWNSNIPVFPICYNEKLNNAIISYDFQGYFIDIDKISNIDFEYVDFNRKNSLTINKKCMQEKSKKHFLKLDYELMEQNYE